MKRRLVFGIALVMVLFAGCARAEPVWETVDDGTEQLVLKQTPMKMVFDVPENAERIGQSPCWCAYAQTDGEYEIVARAIPAADLDAAVYAVAGRTEDELNGILRDGTDGCSFGWYDRSGEEGKVCRAEILSDHAYYYALSFCVRESAGSRYHSTEEQVFASFGLVSGEMG